MKVQFGAIVTAGSGKSGGHVFTTGKTGANMRTKVSPKQPVSNSSAVRRSSFTAIANLWRTLTTAVVTTWNDAAKEIKLSGNFGKSYSPSGFQLFSTLNNNLAQLAVSPVSAVPPVASINTMNSMSLAMAKGAATATLTYSPAVPATVGFVLEATGGIPQSRQPKKSDFRLIGKILTANASPYSFEALYVAKFSAIPVAGQSVYVRVRPVHITGGWGGQPFQANCVVAA